MLDGAVIRIIIYYSAGYSPVFAATPFHAVNSSGEPSLPCQIAD